MTVDEPTGAAPLAPPSPDRTPPPSPRWRRAVPVIAAWAVVAVLLTAVLAHEQGAADDLAAEVADARALSNRAHTERQEQVAAVREATDRFVAAEAGARDAAFARAEARAEEAAAAGDLAAVDDENAETGAALAAATEQLAVTEEQVTVLLECVRTANAAINAASVNDTQRATDILRPTADACALVGLAVLSTASGP